MSIPGQIVFIFVADVVHMGESTIGPVFVFSYLFVSFIQVRQTSQSYRVYQTIEHSNSFFRSVFFYILLTY